jgi:hypothetical protein
MTKFTIIKLNILLQNTLETKLRHLRTNFINDARFEVFMAVKIQVEVFWVVAPCSVVVGYQQRQY